MPPRSGPLTQIDERAAWFYEATTSTKGMKNPRPGFGQSYLASYEDAGATGSTAEELTACASPQSARGSVLVCDALQRRHATADY